jgi:hypothetical protein
VTSAARDDGARRGWQGAEDSSEGSVVDAGAGRRDGTLTPPRAASLCSRVFYSHVCRSRAATAIVRGARSRSLRQIHDAGLLTARLHGRRRRRGWDVSQGAAVGAAPFVLGFGGYALTRASRTAASAPICRTCDVHAAMRRFTQILWRATTCVCNVGPAERRRRRRRWYRVVRC